MNEPITYDSFRETDIKKEALLRITQTCTEIKHQPQSYPESMQIELPMSELDLNEFLMTPDKNKVMSSHENLQNMATSSSDILSRSCVLELKNTLDLESPEFDFPEYTLSLSD